MSVEAERLPVQGAASIRWRRLLMRLGIVGRGPAVLLILLTGAAVIAPAVYVFNYAFAGNPSGVSQMLNATGSWNLVVSTLELALGSGALALVMGTTLAWFASRLGPRWRWLANVPFLPLVVPQLAMVTGYVYLLNPSIGYVNQIYRSLFGGTYGPINPYTLPWMIIIGSFVLTSIVFLFVKTALAQLSQELLDAGSVFGCGPTRLLWKVVLPVMRPALIYGAMTTLLLGIGQITVPIIFGSPVGIHVLGTSIYANTASSSPNFNLAAAYGLPILVVGIIALIFQRVMLRDAARYVTVGGRGSRPATEQSGWAGPTVLIVYALISLVLPLIAIVIVSLQPFWSGHIRVGDFTLHNYSLIFSQDDLREAVTNSFKYAVATVLIGVPVTHGCARIIYANRRIPVLSSIQDAIVNLPLVVPTAIFGLGFLLLYTETSVGLYGNAWGIIILWVVLILPIATRLQLTALVNLGPELNAAARTCGAGFLRRVLTIDLPLLRPALAGGAALVMVVSMQEFTASIFVASMNTQVMGTQLYQLFSFVGYSQAGAMSIVMCVITALGVGLAFLFGGRGALSSTSKGRATVG
ncbi:iron ABC transporter permease [Conexibacter sp. CPCC 206217]|uniref:ABC transporter permease n=1 Tax=Conexibacter sp. CPCC 206217 TaxID=3064574 RepID=UPI0027193860|nr:iron ABC transporter permease [Conexibacter sp. CPCC 206217]MDO8213177.1 iron ABC transporter permease [Conexibacter sp. CPCC 206217]